MFQHRTHTAPSDGCSCHPVNDDVHVASLADSIASNISLSGSFFFDSLISEPSPAAQAHEICGGCAGAAASAGALASAPTTTEVSAKEFAKRCVFF
eukprot:COSAG02_NODE_279_length_25809_cov_21.674173_17_plen_96_part_00